MLVTTGANGATWAFGIARAAGTTGGRAARHRTRPVPVTAGATKATGTAGTAWWHAVPPVPPSPSRHPVITPSPSPVTRPPSPRPRHPVSAAAAVRPSRGRVAWTRKPPP
ncbi:hypothetical protein GCM10010145_40380 [Streptomyces ruber]|uniref:Uncharacterized protein n=2 Tax=Streptomyces TaxID=1883 RepID=A0A918BGE1_9ACTN|nr:hypothetical protein GCM10010145_40380 [Streptomyces ruber]